MASPCTDFQLAPPTSLTCRQDRNLTFVLHVKSFITLVMSIRFAPNLMLRFAFRFPIRVPTGLEHVFAS